MNKGERIGSRGVGEPQPRGMDCTLSAGVAQAETRDIVVTVGIHVSVAAAVDTGQDLGVDVLILCIAGNVVGGGADFSQSAVGQLHIIGQSNDGLVRGHGQAQLAGGVEGTNSFVEGWDGWTYEVPAEGVCNYISSIGKLSKAVKGDVFMEITGEDNDAFDENMKYIGMTVDGQLVICFSESNLCKKGNDEEIGFALIFAPAVTEEEAVE